MPAGWAEETAAAARAQSEKLDGALAAARPTMNKDSMRAAFVDLASFCHQRGDFGNALRHLLRCRDYCSSPRQMADVCTRVIALGFDSGNMMQVSNHVSKAEQGGDPTLQPQLTAASALVLLHSKSYKAAARKFLEVSTPAPRFPARRQTMRPARRCAGGVRWAVTSGRGSAAPKTWR
jgi:COP9 signalosome complex subunit 1